MSTLNTITSELAKLETLTAQKRAELEAQRLAETTRRLPMGKLLSRREVLKDLINVNTHRRQVHQQDAESFAELFDQYFLSPSPGGVRAYAIFDSRGNQAHAARIVEILDQKLNQAADELENLDAEILALATREKLTDMLPVDLK